MSDDAGKDVDNGPVNSASAPRRSQRVSADLAPSDGDVWQEKLAVCEGVTPTGEPRLVIRSLYRNARTQERVWDEPPSGAGTVLHATTEMRKTAEIEREELRLTLEMIPPDEEQNDIPEENNTKEKKGFFGRFRKKKEQKQVETAKDLNLQRAIARSMMDSSRTSAEPNVYFDDMSNKNNIAEDEDFELAKALSISEAIANNPVETDAFAEEEMFQRALTQIRTKMNNNDATGVASMPNSLDASFSSFTHDQSPPIDSFDDYDLDASDHKLPASYQ